MASFLAHDHEVDIEREGDWWVVSVSGVLTGGEREELYRAPGKRPTEAEVAMEIARQLRRYREFNPSAEIIRGLVAVGLVGVGVTGIAMGVRARAAPDPQPNPGMASMIGAGAFGAGLMWLGMIVWCGHQLSKLGKTYSDVAWAEEQRARRSA